MNKNISNDKYVRCNNCGYIYEKSLQSCPECRESNGDTVIEQMISECVEPVFNIND